MDAAWWSTFACWVAMVFAVRSQQELVSQRPSPASSARRESHGEVSGASIMPQSGQSITRLTQTILV